MATAASPCSLAPPSLCRAAAAASHRPHPGRRRRSPMHLHLLLLSLLASPAYLTLTHAQQSSPQRLRQHYHPEPVAFAPPGGFTPLNPDWAVRDAPCPYGELPGTWLPHVAPIIKDWDDAGHSVVELCPHPRPLMPVTHGWDGRGWQVFDPRCQLVNYLRRYITLEAMPAPEDAAPMKLLFIGDRCGAGWAL